MATLLIAVAARQSWRGPADSQQVALSSQKVSLERCCAALKVSPSRSADGANSSQKQHNVTVLLKQSAVQYPPFRPPRPVPTLRMTPSTAAAVERSSTPDMSTPIRTNPEAPPADTRVASSQSLPSEAVLDPGRELPSRQDNSLLPPDSALNEPDVLSATPDAPQGSMDGRMVRSAVAATVLGALADRTRPSQLLGDDGAGSLLGTTIDGFWGLGQQAAMQMIVEGKAPKSSQIKKDAVGVIVATANQEVASLIGDATQYGQDNGIRFLRSLEVSAQWNPGQHAFLEARTIDSLFESEALDHTLFLQASVRSDFEETTANIGLGYRYLVPDSDWMLGANVFYDRQFPIGHERMSIGLEASTADFTLFANRYIALSGWTEKNADFDEKPLSGWDLGIAGQVPRLEDLRVSLAAFHWDQQTEHDKNGLKFTADYDVSPALQLGGTISADDSGNVQGGFRLTYQFGADNFGDSGTNSGSAMDRRLDFVNRENIIRTEKREVPNDYTIQFLASDVNTSNETSIGFEIAGAPLSASYSYAISSSAGGTPVRGSGRVESDPRSIAGIDVSGLADGTLTLTVQVVSKNGASGPKVTAEIMKSTTAVTVTTSAVTSGPVNTGPISFSIVFSSAVSGFELSDLAVTNGTASNLQTSDNITWTVDVMPAGQGAVELQVPAAVATVGDHPNESSNPSTIVFDSEAPSGYGASFLVSTITAAAFEISGAEVGASYEFTITSSGGGAPVTGTGTIGAALQQVTGLDLSGLSDGTLTLSVTLSDTVGNVGSPVTDIMSKDSSAPVIVSITPPPAGTYNDIEI